MTNMQAVEAATYNIEMLRSYAVCEYLLGCIQPATNTTALFIVYLHSQL